MAGHRVRRPRSTAAAAAPRSMAAGIVAAGLLLLLGLLTCQGWRLPAGLPQQQQRRRPMRPTAAASRIREARPSRAQPRARSRWGAGGARCSGIDGWGRVGDRYSWRETEWELEVTVPVPPGTRKEDVLFKVAPTSLKLGLAGATELLLGGVLKGRISVDGSFWSLEGEGADRAVKLLLEKKAGALENSWDWRRVLAEEAATESDYAEPERFDAKEYTRAMLGPQGINMSLVDREMFGSGGLFGNVSKETLRDYVEAKVLDDASGLFPKEQTQPGGGGGEDEEEEEED